MPESKEIKIRAVLDSSTFDKGVNEITEKLRKITQQQAQGAGTQKALGKDTVMGKYAQQAFGDFSKESQRQLEAMYRTQRQEAVSQQVTMKGKQQELDKLAKTDGEMTKQQQQRVDLLKKEIDLLKEKHRQTLTTASETQKALDKMGGGGQPPGGVPTTGGVGGQPPSGGASGVFSSFLRGMSALALARGGFNTAMDAYSNFFVTRPREMEAAKGQVMTGAARDMREQFAGKGSDRAFWAAERSKAFDISKQERERQEKADLVKGAVGATIGGLTGKAVGGTIGAAVGTAILPGLGTAAGGYLGAAVGGTAGAYGGAGLMGGEKSRSSIFDPEKYRAQSMAEMLKNREQIEASLIAQDPRKAHAREYFRQNYEDMSRFERATGVRDRAEMYGGGGLLRTQMRIGEQYGGGMLSMEDIQSQVGQIYGAGGGTQGAQMAGFGAAVGRQTGITNTGQLMGRLQGMGGLGNEGTQDAVRRLLAEAVRLGVDASKMPQEMERMTAMTAQIATAGGGYSTIAAQMAGAGVMGLSAGQIQAAGGAYEKFQAGATETEGVGGQIGWGYMLGEKSEKIMGRTAMRQIRQDPRMMNLFQNLSAADLQKDAGLLKGLSEQLGVDEDTILKFSKELGAEKQTYSTPEAEAAAAYGESIKGKTPEEISAMQTAPGAEGERFRAGKLAFAKQRGGTRGKEFFGGGAYAREAQMGMIGAAVTGYEGAPLGPAEVAVKETMERPQVSATEKERASAARGQADMLYNLNQNIDAFGLAADQSVKNAGAINFAMDSFEKALRGGGDKVSKELENVGKQLEEFSKTMERAGYPAAAKSK